MIDQQASTSLIDSRSIPKNSSMNEVSLLFHNLKSNQKSHSQLIFVARGSSNAQPWTNPELRHEHKSPENQCIWEEGSGHVVDVWRTVFALTEASSQLKAPCFTCPEEAKQSRLRIPNKRDPLASIFFSFFIQAMSRSSSP